MDIIEKSIFKTLTYFDLLARPLTLNEVWQNLYRGKANKLVVLLSLRKLIKKKIVEKNGSYYFLYGRKKIVKNYLLKREISKKRWQKAYSVINVLKFIPFIKNVSVINSLSFSNSTDRSDIDILIVTAKNRLWTVRAFTVLLLEILNQNKNKWYQANKFCLGFAFDENRLDLTKIKYKKDIDFTYWLSGLMPVCDRGIYKKLIDENEWIYQELPCWQPKEIIPAPVNKTRLEKFLSGQFGDKLEKFLAKIQINKILKDPINRRPGASVIADSSMMKLHAFDGRKERQNLWEEGIKRPLTRKSLMR